MRAKSLQTCLTLCNPMDCSPPGSSVGFTKQEYGSGLSYPPPGDLLNPGIQPASLASRLHWQVDSLPLLPPGMPPNPKWGNLPLDFVIPVALSSSDPWAAFSDSKSNLISPHDVYFWNNWLCAKLLQLCTSFWDPMDCSPPGSSVHGILQARILEWVAMPSSRGSSQPRDGTFCSRDVSCSPYWQVGSLPPAPPSIAGHMLRLNHLLQKSTACLSPRDIFRKEAKVARPRLSVESRGEKGSLGGRCRKSFGVYN